MTDFATLRITGSLARLSLNRPDARNALSIDLLDALHGRIDELTARKDVTAMILSGEGKSFCAGMDLKQVINEPGAPHRLLSSLAEFTLKLRAAPMMTIASVNGAAIGGGCGLACVCDFAVTHADSRMGFPEVDLGVCPAVVAPWLIRRIGAGRARRVLLAGGTMSGREAHAIGIATHLVESRDELDAGVEDLAGRLSQGGPEALRATKALLNELDGSSDPSAVRSGAALSASVLEHEETRATLRAKLGL
ncbi:MAG: enoyl-CoA hydratase/isomerase family protein [Phycisphaerales bacterium]